MPCIFLLLCLALSQATASQPVTTENDAVLREVANRKFPWLDAEKQVFIPLQPPSSPPPPPQDTAVNQPSADYSPLSFAIRILLWIVLIAIVGWLGYLFYLSLANEQEAPVDELPTQRPLDAARLEALPAAVRTVTDFLAEAQRLLRLNQFSEAMIFYYSWQLVTLDHAGAIELEAGKTNRQYLREAAQKRADLSDLFAQSTHQFEEAFYGQIPTQREDFLALWKRREEFAPPASPRRRA